MSSVFYYMGIIKTADTHTQIFYKNGTCYEKWRKYILVFARDCVGQLQTCA